MASYDLKLGIINLVSLLNSCNGRPTCIEPVEISRRDFDNSHLKLLFSRCLFHSWIMVLEGRSRILISLSIHDVNLKWSGRRICQNKRRYSFILKCHFVFENVIPMITSVISIDVYLFHPLVLSVTTTNFDC